MKTIIVAHAISGDICTKKLKSNRKGLSNIEANKRLAENGQNLLPQPKHQPAIIRFLLKFVDFMIIILLFAAIVSIVFGEYIDGSIILAIVILNAVLGFVQEGKAEKALLVLKNMSKPIVKVMRDGVVEQIESSKLVEGDIVILEAGNIVPADLRLLECAALKCDESSLTGESEPITKNSEVCLDENVAIGDRINMAFSGSIVVYGRGLGIVVQTGENTEIGKIAKMLNDNKKELTPLQKSLKTIGLFITISVLVIAGITFVLEITRGTNVSILDAFLTSVAIAVAAIPESLPAVVTIIMALGVSKLAKKKAIIKKLHAVETLGCCSIICSDKTGTLTQNIMTVKKVFYNNNICDYITKDTSNDDLNKLLTSFSLCNDSFDVNGKFVGDPTETALCEYAYKLGIDKKVLDQNNKRMAEIPFDSNRKLMSTIHFCEGVYTQYTKGAVDELLKKCTHYEVEGKIKKLDDEQIKTILQANTSMSNEALRVLGTAYKKINSLQSLDENNLIFMGMAGMIDPPRPDVKKAVKQCFQAGMRPIMITGDHKNTALAIAKEIGICTEDGEALTGIEIDNLSDEEFIKKLQTINVFARVSPENKVRIVETLKKLGNVVAMTGDGVNDAPSLKRANIGVGMGITGTDVTKEAADMVVTDDSFSTIVVAVNEGRKIYGNIQKTINFLFASNFCEVFALLICLIVFPNLVFLFPIQILFVNLITDSLPAMALSYEESEKDIMKKPPRKTTNIFKNGVGISIILQGIFQCVIVLSSFIAGYYLFNNAVATTMAFVTLNFVQIFFLISMRTNDSIFKTNPFKNKWLNFAVLAIISVILVLILTPINKYIKLEWLSGVQWAICLGLSAFIIVFNELLKLVRKKMHK